MNFNALETVSKTLHHQDTKTGIFERETNYKKIKKGVGN